MADTETSGLLPETKAWRAVRMVLGVLVFLVGAMKVAGQLDKIAELGIPLYIIPLIGAFEVVNALLFLWPKTAFYGGAFQTIVMIVAAVAHASSQDWIGLLPVLVLGMLIGITAWRIRPDAIR